MRAWTLGVSIVFHFCVITGVIVAPLLATGDLPEPRRAAPEYVLVTAHLPEPPAPRNPVTPAPTTAAAPLTPPDNVVPEPAQRVAAPGPTDFDLVGGDPNGTGLTPGAVVAGDPLPPPPPPPAPAPKELYRVGGDIRPPQKIRDVAPRYPTMAQAAGIEGLVILEAVIGEDGTVQNVRVLRGKPLLDQAAVDAVQQWRFTPTLLNRQPVPVVMTVTVSFSMKR